MKKSSFAALTLGTISCVFFALGIVYGFAAGMECI